MLFFLFFLENKVLATEIRIIIYKFLIIVLELIGLLYQLLYIEKLQLFTYHEDNNIIGGDEFKHCIKVLRKKKNDKVLFTDGKGNLSSSHIDKINKDNCHLNK